MISGTISRICTNFVLLQLGMNQSLTLKSFTSLSLFCNPFLSEKSSFIVSNLLQRGKRDCVCAKGIACQELWLCIFRPFFCSSKAIKGNRSITNDRQDSTIYSYIRGRSQTTFTRRGRQVVQKCPLFFNVHTIENVNAGGRWSKNPKSCQRSL